MKAWEVRMRFDYIMAHPENAGLERNLDSGYAHHFKLLDAAATKGVRREFLDHPDQDPDLEEDE